MNKYIYFLIDRNQSIDSGFSVEIIKVRLEDEDKFFKLFKEVNNLYKESRLNGGIFTIIAKTQNLVQVYDGEYSDDYITPVQELVGEVIYDLQNLDRYVDKSLLENIYKINFQNV